jgi:hypothetical protein
MANPTPAPAVRLELRNGAARPVTYEVTGDEFVIGTVPGCDLRLAGPNLPPVMCVVARSAEGPRLRKLAPALPLLLNSRPVQTAALRSGDTISLGSLSIAVQVTGATPQTVGFVPMTPSASPAADSTIAEHRRKLDDQAAELEADRVLWYRRREELENECRDRQHAADSEHRRREDLYQDAAAALQARIAECDKRELLLAQREAENQTERQRTESLRTDLEQRQQEFADRTAQLTQHAEALAVRQREVDTLRDELTAEKRDLHQRYQERRDRLAGLQQAVDVAVRKAQDIKRELTAREQAHAPRLAEIESVAADLARREQDVAAGQDELLRARQAVEACEAEAVAKLRAAQDEYDRKQGECAVREKELKTGEDRHRADLVRLDRFQDVVERRERQAAATETDVARREEELRRRTLELDEQARQIALNLAAQKTENERLIQEKALSEETKARLAEHASTVQSEQAALADLRTRLEQMRDEAQQESASLADRRARHEAVEREVEDKARAADEMRARAESDSLAHAAERQIFDGQSSELRASIARLDELQLKLNAEEAELSARRDKLDAREAEQTALAADVQNRTDQLQALQERLNADQLTLAERERILVREEETRTALGEQFRRHGEDLVNRQRQLDERTQEIEARAGQVGGQYQATEAALATARQQIDHQMAEMRLVADRISAVEAEFGRREDRLRAAGRALAFAKKAHTAEKARWAINHETAMAEAGRQRAELEEFRRQTAADAETLRKQLPELELRGQAVLVRLGQAREELRGHLGGLHDYARQGQEDLESVQARLRAEGERLREQEATINRARSEHRLAVSTFRQQLLEWQGRVADMRRVLVGDGVRPERQDAEVTAASQHVDDTARQLAEQAAELQAAERKAVERRDETERRLHDLRDWYRTKLRELAECGGTVRLRDHDGDTTIIALRPPDAKRTTASANDEPTILSLTDDLNPGDRQLGELLRSLDLVDAESATALLLEARRQRRSLRQVLLSGRGDRAPLLTLYQLALIESGNLEALVLGPTRVVDRLQATAREAVYRVFDPRRTGEGQSTILLRHLSESEMHDALRPDEFRARFAALASLPSAHLIATLEVLEINNRPAVLQEWLTGLPAADWPPLTTMPAVWHRLMIQTATGLHAAHEAGLVHGGLTAKSVVLTPLGLVKLSGCGEPPWLTGRPADATAADDLTALGELAAAWATGVPRRKSAKAVKPLPAELQRILDRLRGDALPYSSTAELLDDLRRTAGNLPPIGEAWDEFLAFAAENAAEGAALRKAA